MSGPVVAVTGARSVGEHGPEVIRAAFRGLGVSPSVIVTGGAYGVDTAAFLAGRELFPDARHVIRAPSGLFCNRDLTDAVEREAVEGGRAVVEWVTGRGRESAYLVRDRMIVDGSDVLLAFPRSPVERRRSGTWYTVRYARRTAVPVRLFPLSGVLDG